MADSGEKPWEKVKIIPVYGIFFLWNHFGKEPDITKTVKNLLRNIIDESTGKMV